MKTLIQSVKGTRDFYPEEMAIRAWLYKTINEVSASFGYQEIDGPFLEKIELYAAKSGEELVKEQSFVFQDRGGDFLTLRPELTPSVARMVAQRQGELAYPLRWWSFGPFWRYERPQKGRTREFFQWNIDMIGTTAPESDAELAAVAASFFQKVGLNPQHVKIMVNNRRLMDQELSLLGISDKQRPQVFHLIDRSDKMKPDEWKAYALETGISEGQIIQIYALLADHDLWKKSEEMCRFYATLDGMGLLDYIQYDAHVIRGLDYYTGVVFEGREQTGEGRAILGGGRYDNLVNDVGGDPLPGVGFAMGDVMIGVILAKYGRIPAYTPSPAPILVTVFDEAHLVNAYALAATIRRSGFNVCIYPEAAKLPKQFKFADKLGFRFVIVEGPDEEAKSSVTVKDLGQRCQVTIRKHELTEYLDENI